MQYHFKCPVKDCLFQITLNYDASEAECVEAATRLQKHLRSHSVDALAEAVFRLLTLVLRKETT